MNNSTRYIHRGALVVLIWAWGLPSMLSGTTPEEIGGCSGTTSTEIAANPSNYRNWLDNLEPGDILLLEPGVYTQGLPLNSLEGEPNNCITIAGPEVWPPVVRFTPRTCCNTVSISNSSYVVLRNLELDGSGDTESVDGVKVESGASFAHHITLENLYIHDHDFSQQTVGISTKAPSWNFVIRRNVIERCGTGAYFGNSDGEDEFVNGLIEQNLFIDTVGYNLQIKHQNGRNTGLGIPAAASTILRNNVFSKGDNSSSGGGARPNLLVGHWPLSGAGSGDEYLIYGNFFWENPDGVEALFQGEGNVNLYSNLMVNTHGPAVAIQAQNDQPRNIFVFQNTVIADATGLRVQGVDSSATQRVVGNAVFANPPFSLHSNVEAADNVVDSESEADLYLNSVPPAQPSEGLDLFPLANDLLAVAVDTSGLQEIENWDLDFNGLVREVDFAGAYGGQGQNPGWLPALERMPDSKAGSVFADGFESGGTSAWSDSLP